MRELKAEKIREAIKHTAAELLSEISNRTSLITVTNVILTLKGDKAIVLITVYPEDAETAALEFTKRKAKELREMIGKRLSIHRIPFITFAIDKGEKIRQQIDKLSS